MATEATVIADSISPAGSRILTYKLVYPWFIHWDLLTHRALSRNAMSSRAIPIRKMLRKVWNDPAMPVYWGRNGKGMQAKGELPPPRRFIARSIWLSLSRASIAAVWALEKVGLHKQDANKLLTPFLHITTVVTATEWGNFFNLRAHRDAHPSFQQLAYKMLEAYVASTPRQLEAGGWHLPFADRYVDDVPDTASLLKIVTARCARVSYLNFEGDIDFSKDYRLHNDLLGNGHMSPFEHPAQALADGSEWSGNFRGFRQYRKTIPNENRCVFDPRQLLHEWRQRSE